MSEVAAAAGDGVFGPTSERENGGRRRATATATATATTEVLSPPDFFPSSRFPSDLVD